MEYIVESPKFGNEIIEKVNAFKTLYSNGEDVLISVQGDYDCVNGEWIFISSFLPVVKINDKTFSCQCEDGEIVESYFECSTYSQFLIKTKED